jgi:hypothetical protein
MSSTTTKPSKAQALAQVQALIAGTEKNTPNGTFTLASTTYTAASLIQLLQGLENALTALDAAQATAKDAKSAFDAEQAKVGPVLRAYRKQLYTTYGNAAQLADYGLTPHKARTPPTAEQRAAAVQKLRATRKARGTTSKKQKAAIHGTVETPTTTGQPPAAATPAPTPPKTAV